MTRSFLRGGAVRRSASFLMDVVVNAVVIVLVVILVRYILISPFQVNGSSMEPTFENNALLIVDKISYRIGDPKRGDIVVFAPPENTDIFFVKRIIGLPGDTVEFHNGQILIHTADSPAGELINEPYLSLENARTYLPSHENGSYTVPANQYFVMGDNRNASNDSRRCFSSEGCTEGRVPFLHRANIEGRALIVLWPPRDWTVVRRPTYALAGDAS